MNQQQMIVDPRYAGAVEAYRQAMMSGSTVQKDQVGQTGWNVATGLQAYNLEAPAKMLYPLTAILRRMIARVTPNPISDVMHWKIITGVGKNVPSVSLNETESGALSTKSEYNRQATVGTIGLREEVTFNAQWYGKDYQDIRAAATLTTLQNLMVGEEDKIIGGNTAVIAPPAAPSGVAVALGGALPIDLVGFSLKVSPLSLEGYRNSQIAGYDPNANTAGEGLPSAASAVVPSTTDDAIEFSFADVPNAVAHNAFIQTGGAGLWYYAGTVTTNAFVLADVAQITAIAANGADGSANAKDFPGIIAQYNAADSGAVAISLDGAVLTSDGAGGVKEISDFFDAAYLESGVGPNYILGSPGMIGQIRELCAGGTPPLRINLSDGMKEIKGGISFKSLLNWHTGEDVELVSHRTFPPNMLLFLRITNPYDYSNLANAMDMAVVKDYYQVDYGITVGTGRVWSFGVYASECLRVYFAGGGGMMKNIGTS